MDSEIIKFLNSKEVKAFGWAVTIVTVVAGAAFVYRNILTTKVLWQQSQINKYILAEKRSQKPISEQKKIEQAETIQTFS